MNWGQQLFFPVIKSFVPITFIYIPVNLFDCTADEFGMVKNTEDQFLRDSGYKRHAFNILVSNNIGLVRDVPDTRNKLWV